jgi:hypothetical protein
MYVLEVGAGLNLNWTRGFLDKVLLLLLCPAFDGNEMFFQYALRYAVAMRTRTDLPSQEELLRCVPLPSNELDTMLESWEEWSEPLPFDETVEATLEKRAEIKDELKEAFRDHRGISAASKF